MILGQILDQSDLESHHGTSCLKVVPKCIKRGVRKARLFGLAMPLRDQDVENRLPQIQREIESSLQVGV